MSVATALWLAAVLAAYVIGKGVGRAQVRDEQLPPVRLTLEVFGETLGGVEIHGMKVRASSPDL